MADKNNLQQRLDVALEALEQCRDRAKAAETASTIYRSICEVAPVGLFFTDIDGLSVYTNPTNQRQMGMSLEETLGTGWQEAIHPDDRATVFEAFAQAVASGAVYRGSNRYLRSDGTIVEVSVKAASVPGDDGPIGFVGVAEDVTAEEKRLRERSRTERLEAIGRLAGGIAHDFNNLLTVIMGFAEMIQNDASQSEAASHEILQATRRASDLTGQLLAFARRQVTEPVVFDAIEGLRELHSTVRRVLPENVKLSFVFNDEPWLIEIDPTQFQQLILNLVVNARDSMPQGGELAVEVSNVTIDDDAASVEHDIKTGDYVRISVSDTGEGMSPETVSRAFEPFFTTKEEKGTGLGLATCFGIVRQAGGLIWVYSEPGAGTTFKIFFPRVTGARTGPREITSEPRGLTGNEVVLVVEDEKKLREVLADALAGLGYRVHAASNGQEAVELAETLTKLDVVVSDVVMPILSGPEAIGRILRTHPKAKALYVSGYTENAIAMDGILKPGIAFLPKPYTPRELARRIRRLLSEE